MRALSLQLDALLELVALRSFPKPVLQLLRKLFIVLLNLSLVLLELYASQPFTFSSFSFRFELA